MTQNTSSNMNLLTGLPWMSPVIARPHVMRPGAPALQALTLQAPTPEAPEPLAPTPQFIRLQPHLADSWRQPVIEPTEPDFTKRNTEPLPDTAGPPLFFFSENDRDHGWLSQRYLCKFDDPYQEPQHTYNCAEQYVLYRKALALGCDAIASEILRTLSPRPRTSLTDYLKDNDSDEWVNIKMEVMEEANFLKFTQYTNVASWNTREREPVPLKDLLLATGNRELVNADPCDRVLGIGWKAEDARKVQRSRWGLNLFGKLLMKIRDELRRQADEKRFVVKISETWFQGPGCGCVQCGDFPPPQMRTHCRDPFRRIPTCGYLIFDLWEADPARFDRPPPQPYPTPGNRRPKYNTKQLEFGEWSRTRTRTGIVKPLAPEPVAPEPVTLGLFGSNGTT